MKQLLNTFHRDFDLLLGKYLPVKPAFLKMGQSRPLFVYFRLFYMTQIKYKLIKALMACLGLEPTELWWRSILS